MYNPCMGRPKALTIGIAGGSGSGKTTVAQEILSRVGADRIAFLQHDSYYKDLSGLPPAQRAELNFDHPNSLETDLLTQHILALRDGSAVVCRELLLQQRHDACCHHIERGGVEAAFGDDYIGVAFRGFNEFKVHRSDGELVLSDH